MKILTLLRHAKSSWDDPVARDFDRPLNKKGGKAARTVGRAMRAEGLVFDRVVASPAVRVIETIAEMEKGYGASLNPDYDQRLYLASTAALLQVMHEIERSVGRLLVIGHNPGLESLALMLSQGIGPLHAELALKYPTATLAEIALSVDRWADAGAGVGTLTRFIRPRDLDPSLGPDEDGH